MNKAFYLNRRKITVGRIAALMAVAVGGTSTWSWFAGIGDIFSTTKSGPIAPLAAFTLLGLGAGLWMALRWPNRPLPRFVAGISVAVGLSAAVWALIAKVVSLPAQIEQWFVSGLSPQLGENSGLIAPLTGTLFAAAAVSLWLRLKEKYRDTGSALAGIVGSVGALKIAALASFPANGLINSTLWLSATAAAGFFFMAIALAVFPEGANTERTPPAHKWLEPLPVTICAALLVGMAIGAARYLRFEIRDRLGPQGVLATVNATMRSQILQWRHERLDDARFFSRAEFVARDVQDLYSNPSSPAAQKRILNWMKLVEGGDRYSQVALFDTNQTLRLATAGGAELNTPATEIRDAIQSGEVALSDVRTGLASLHMDLVVPVFATRGESPGLEEKTPIGALAFRIDPEQSLRALLNFWPVQVPSARATLFYIDRNGPEPIAQGSTTNRGTIKGRSADAFKREILIPEKSRLNGYLQERVEGGEVVVAYSREIEGLPWLLVTQMTRMAIYEPVRKEAFGLLAGIICVVSLAGFVSGFFIKRREAAEALRTLEAQRTQLALAERLRESEEQFRAMFELASIGMALVKIATGEFLRVNKKYCEITGYTREELLKMRVDDVTHPEDQERDRHAYRETVSMPGREYFVEKRYVRKDRAIAWVNISVTVVCDSDGVARTSLGAVEDVTSRKRLEEQYRQAQKMEAIGQLAGGVAHDFNNILAAMMMQLGLLESSPFLDEESRQGVAELTSHAQRAAGLTRQLLMFSRRSVMQARPLNLNHVVDNLLKMLGRIIGENIELEWRGASELPNAHADTGMMEQIIMNLVVNGRDAIRNSGRISITTAAVTLTEANAMGNPDAQAGEFVCLAVSDTGCGMDESILRHIFEPFFTTKEVGKGTGLGLATVYGIVKQHQGWVTVKSEVGRGSTFEVFIPSVSAMESRKIAKAPAGSIPRDNKTILLVEDDGAVRATTSILLRRHGYKTLEATNGREAIEIWEKERERIHLLLTDMVMPNGISGLDIAKRFCADKPDLDVIVTSGYSADLVQNDLAALGIVFLPKPADAAALGAALQQAFGSG